MNAANEQAVALFLDGKLPFTRIVPSVADVLAAHSPVAVDSLETLAEVDAWARREVSSLAVSAVSPS